MASPSSTTNITTADELLNAPESLGRCELVKGELVTMSPAKGRHGAVGAAILGLLGPFVRSQQLGRAFDSSTGYVVARDPDTVREPDVSFMTDERLRDQDMDAFLEGAPDLAVEVLSPSNTQSEIRAKLDDYFAAGCQVAWIVDPQRRSVTVYRAAQTALEVLGEDDTLTEESLLPGFAAAIREIFA